MNWIRVHQSGWWWLLAGLVITCAVYSGGLSGGFLFDDYPNIVDNHGVQPQEASIGALVRAALSSPSSEFKRPLASLSFAINYLLTGLDPFWMKFTNLFIHLLNGVLVFLLTRTLLRTQQDTEPHAGRLAAWVASGWLLLPINLTAVLYVVQRMESLANLFVLVGLLGYTAGRLRMLASASRSASQGWFRSDGSPLLLCFASVTVPAAVGLLAKETAVMLPLYAVLIEWTLFGFRRANRAIDRRIVGFFACVLGIPLTLGLIWLLPGVLHPGTWATRDFTLSSRLLSEARIVTDYIGWTLAPTPDALSFYHDDFEPSAGLFQPWTTFTSIVVLLALLALGTRLKTRRPRVSLGILFFLGCHLLTGTILPLELIYEHRNYFASYGLLLAIVPFLARPAAAPGSRESVTSAFALPRHALLWAMLVWWTVLTTFTSISWGDPLHLAEELAGRNPRSPRAQYELGRTYIIYSRYDPSSPFTKLAYAPLERASLLPGSSILPQQALIFMNSRMHLPIEDAWWDSMIAKLKARRPGVQDESSLQALTQCAREDRCPLSKARMVDAFLAALSHPDPDARLLETYGDYAWNVLADRELGFRMAQAAVHTDPSEAAYWVTACRMAIVLRRPGDAERAIDALKHLNVGGRFSDQIAELQALLPSRALGPH